MSINSTGQTNNIEMDQKEDDGGDIVVDDDLVKLSKFTKIIAPLFLVFGVFALIVSILSLANVEDGEWIFFFAVLLGTIIFSILAAWGVYKWGTVAEQIEIFKEENGKYETQIGELKKTKEQLGESVGKLQDSTTKLERNVDTLKETLSQYDDLKNSLQDICGENQELNDLIGDVNDMYSGIQNIVRSNTRAGILSAYYENSLKDDTPGMSKREYKRFMGRLDKKTRGIFKSFGSFETLAGDDNIIDLNEFQALVDRLLEAQADDLVSDQMGPQND